MKFSVLTGRPVTKSSCNNSPVADCVIERLYSLNFLIPELLWRKQGRQLFVDVSRRVCIPGVKNLLLKWASITDLGTWNLSISWNCWRIDTANCWGRHKTKYFGPLGAKDIILLIRFTPYLNHYNSMEYVAGAAKAGGGEAGEGEQCRR